MDRRRFIRNSAGLLLVPVSASGLSMISHKMKGDGEKIRLGVIGTGIRGSYIVKLVQQHVSGVDVIACCDILDDHLQKGIGLAASGAKAYRDYRCMLDDPEVHAVVIATPLHLHYLMAKEAMDAGKHVYCEKTMTYNIPQSLDLLSKISESAVVFQVGYQQRTNPLFQKIHKLIHSGSCGRITHIDCNWNRNGSWRRQAKDPSQERIINWRMYREYSGGLMAELCSHQIDIVNWILGVNPKRISGMGGINYWKDGRETYDNVSAIFEYPEGIKAKFTALTTNAHEGFKMKLYGTRATIEVNSEGMLQGYIYPESSGQDIPDSDLDAITGATQQAWNNDEAIQIIVGDGTSDETATIKAFEHFVDCIVNNKTPLAGVKAGHVAGAAVHMANLSMHNATIEYWKDEYDTT